MPYGTEHTNFANYNFGALAPIGPNGEDVSVSFSIRANFGFAEETAFDDEMQALLDLLATRYPAVEAFKEGEVLRSITVTP